MAKYVCDYSKIYDIGAKIVDTGGEIEKYVKSYETNLISSLASWTAESKDRFVDHVNGKVNTNLNKVSQSYITLGEYLQNCVKKIYDLECELAQLDI